MKFEYKVGDKVCRRSNQAQKGVVTEAEDEWEIRVHWDGKESPLYAETSNLIPDTEEAIRQLDEYNKEVQSKVDEAVNALEAAFKAWCDARDMYPGQHQIMHDPLIDTKALEGVISKFGWDTSSLYC